MEDMKRNGYILKTDISELSKDMIASLDGNNKTVDGDRFSSYFILAVGEKDPEAEAVVSLVESKANLDSSEYHYTVLLIDSISGGDDSESVLFQTNEMTEEDLTRLLQEIWCGLGTDEEPGDIDKEAEFAFLKSYIRGACFDDEVSVDYLYALWIAFCLHHGLTVDKDEYQERLEELWKALEESDGGEVSHWENYSDFDSDMSRKLC